MKIEMPPSEFVYFINNNVPDFNFQNWETSIEYKLWRDGYNCAVRKIRDTVEYQYKIQVV